MQHERYLINNREDIVDWLYDNRPFVMETYTLLDQQAYINIQTFDTIFHHVIKEQMKNNFISILSVACSKDLGISMEDFLIVLEDDNLYTNLVEMCENTQ